MWGVLALGAELYWHSYNHTTYCGDEKAWDPNTPFVWPQHYYSDKSSPEASFSRFGYFTWNETTFDFNATLHAIPVLRTSAMDSNARGMEIGNAWFFVAPGSALTIDLSGLVVRHYNYRIEPPDPIHDWMLLQGIDAFVRVRDPRLPIHELVLLVRNGVESPDICPQGVKFNCECVEYHETAMCKDARTEPVAPLCQRWDNYLLEEVAITSGVFVLTCLIRYTQFLKPSWLAAGMCVWLPANIISDGLVLMVPISGNLLAAAVVLSIQLGNLPLLAIKQYTLTPNILYRCVVSSFLTGGVSLFMMMIVLNAPVLNAPTAVFALTSTASILAGVSGAVGCTGLWGLVDQENVRSLSLGMSLGSAMTGALLFIVKASMIHPRVYYVAGLSAYILSCVLGWVSPLEQNEKTEIEYTTTPTRNYNGAFFVLYMANYGLLSLLPYAMSYRYWYYAVAVIVTNIADAFGRGALKSDVLHYEKSTYVFWALSAFLMAIQHYSTKNDAYFGTILALLSIATCLRGGLITVIQARVKTHATGAHDGWWLAAYGQAGGCFGALVALFLSV